MNAKNYAIHFCFGLMMLALFAYPWIINPGGLRNQIMTAVALVNCFLYPFAKLTLEDLVMRVVGKGVWKKKFFTVDPVGNSKIRALHWIFSFIFAIPICALALPFMKK
ncbi:hypothetical protein BW31_01447 [Pantoea agglomerans]|uniref:hypothetical protein n=1 Tax=Enterobacter agglomerans TaxID=549 RepID=UPI00044AB620|nr:hypothetical protein [Pantoea agglomerans]EZI34404.1 hypothetical protein BW31_01447 [Pantoea agglomerans]